MTPCNMTHYAQVDYAKEGVAMAGGTPREFTTISVSDGVGMNHEGMKFSLVSREIIADSIEAVIHGHAYDGLVGYGGCDRRFPASSWVWYAAMCPLSSSMAALLFPAALTGGMFLFWTPMKLLARFRPAP